MRRDPSLRHWPAPPGREVKKWEELLPAEVGWPRALAVPLVWHARIVTGRPVWAAVEVREAIEDARGRPCGVVLADGEQIKDRSLLRWAPGR